jgi:Ca2+/H+ antiporter
VFAQSTTASLALSAGSLLLPVAFRASFTTIDQPTVLKISRGSCIILLVVYGVYIFTLG